MFFISQKNKIRSLLFGYIAVFFGTVGSLEAETCPRSERPEIHSYGAIRLLSLSGSHFDMGYQYGQSMASPLEKALDVILDYYRERNGVPYDKILRAAEAFTQRFSYSYDLFIRGISAGSGLSYGDCQILNAMETLGSLLSSKSNLGQCAFISLPPEKSYANRTLIGRNYDFPYPYNVTAQDLTVTILRENNTIPTAIIGMPGQIYCPSCINAAGLFLELNNGQPSGGFSVEMERTTLLINMLEGLQNSQNLEALTHQLLATQSDYSLILNAANKTLTRSFEFSSTLGMRPEFPESGTTFVSTNFFLNTTWQGIPMPTDNTTWMGVTRRDNLLNLSSKKDLFDIEDFQDLMDTDIENGGALWPLTIYQIIYETEGGLYLKIPQEPGASWTYIPLSELLRV